MNREITLTENDLEKIAQRHVIGTETGTPIVEIAEWERDALCDLARTALRSSIQRGDDFRTTTEEKHGAFSALT